MPKTQRPPTSDERIANAMERIADYMERETAMREELAEFAKKELAKLVKKYNGRKE